MKLVCSICGEDLPNPDFARNYPNFVCRKCDQRAVDDHHGGYRIPVLCGKAEREDL